MSNSLDPDQAGQIQARPFVGPDLGPNCLPRLSADDNGRQRVKEQQLSLAVERIVLSTGKLPSWLS